MVYEELVDEIFASSLRIRYVVVIDETGRVIAGGIREGVEPIGSESDDKKVASEAVLFRHVREEWDRLFGKVRFNISSRRRLRIMSFYLNGEILLITTELDISLLITDKILDILRKYGLVSEG